MLNSTDSDTLNRDSLKAPPSGQALLSGRTNTGRARFVARVCCTLSTCVSLDIGDRQTLAHPGIGFLLRKWVFTRIVRNQILALCGATLLGFASSTVCDGNHNCRLLQGDCGNLTGSITVTITDDTLNGNPGTDDVKVVIANGTNGFIDQLRLFYTGELSGAQRPSSYSGELAERVVPPSGSVRVRPYLVARPERLLRFFLSRMPPGLTPVTPSRSLSTR